MEKDPIPQPEKTSYDVLLERLDAIEKNYESLKTSYNEVTEFNRSLLSRAGIKGCAKTSTELKTEEALEKFKTMLKEEQ